ncbi:MAG: hypothetical protein GXP49_18545 [Deltaproteobacteria bacterium]|nr:hypothetical protein [Deltaproteobacteria bacterium]
MTRKLIVLSLASITFLFFKADVSHAKGLAWIEVKAIRAAEKGDKIDAGLKGMAGQLKKRFKKFKSYELIKNKMLKLDVGGTGGLKIGPQKKVKVKFKARSKKNRTLTLGLTIEKPKFYTEIELRPGSLVLIGGPKLDRGVLVIAVKVLNPGT